MRRSFVIKRSFVLANKSCNGKQFSWVRNRTLWMLHGFKGSGEEAYIPYFFGGGSVKYTKNTMWLVPPYRIFFKWFEPNAQRISKLTSAQFCVVAMKYGASRTGPNFFADVATSTSLETTSPPPTTVSKRGRSPIEGRPEYVLPQPSSHFQCKNFPIHSSSPLASPLLPTNNSSPSYLVQRILAS